MVQLNLLQAYQTRVQGNFKTLKLIAQIHVTNVGAS